MLIAALRIWFSRFWHDPFEGAFPDMQRGRDQERDWHAVEKAYVFGHVVRVRDDGFEERVFGAGGEVRQGRVLTAEIAAHTCVSVKQELGAQLQRLGGVGNAGTTRRYSG